jgi:hypothetical protein
MAGMENFYRPPGSDPRGNQPTEQFWPGHPAPAGQQGHRNPGDGYQWQQPPMLATHTAKDRRKALHAAVGLTVAAILAGGGVIAGVSLAGNSASTPTASTGSTGSTSAGSPASQAALLNATLSTAASPDAAMTTTAAIRRRIVRFLLLRGVDGQFAFHTRSGAIKTLAYERGVIETLNAGSSIVVKAADGTTWTWDLVTSTVIRDRGGKLGESALAGGEPVWVGGPVVIGRKDARLIVVRPPDGASSSGQGN